MDAWMDGWMDVWVDGCMGVWVDGWVGGWLDGWMDGCMDVSWRAPGYTRLANRSAGDGQEAAGR